ncbi:MAG: hypothetical protein WAO15_19825 [Mycobacterium sp.]
MAFPPLPADTLTPVAFFPQKYFLENLAVRADNSILITAVLQKELWWVPPAQPGAVVDPVLLHSFDHPVTGIAEVAPDVFIVNLTEAYTTHKSHLSESISPIGDRGCRYHRRSSTPSTTVSAASTAAAYSAPTC